MGTLLVFIIRKLFNNIRRI